MKQFIVRLTVGFIVPCLALMLCWYWIFTTSHWDNVGLLNLQVAKLKANKKKKFKVLFIGDSSGGNAIKTDNKNYINLSLSGSYGYEGVNAFLHLVRRYIDYDTVVVINTIDIPTRPVSEQAVWMPDIYSNNILDRINAFRYSFSLLHPLLEYAIGHKFDIGNKFDLNSDFPVHFNKTKKTRNLIENPIDPKKMNEFVKLDARLKKDGIPYFMFFGPSLPYDSAYFHRLSDTIASRKIAHGFNKPFPMDASNVGNTEDHIHPTHAHETTRYYFELLRSR